MTPFDAILGGAVVGIWLILIVRVVEAYTWHRARPWLARARWRRAARAAERIARVDGRQAGEAILDAIDVRDRASEGAPPDDQAAPGRQQ